LLLVYQSIQAGRIEGKTLSEPRPLVMSAS